ncbi:MAG TPA: cupin domain-containing protein [Armatimonadota bacterium]|nr:cupin domain-containing protein [Armatimonadota bacterium]
MTDSSTPELKRAVVRRGAAPTAAFPWGAITWMDCAEITGSETLTFGVVRIDAGQSNPAHRHPNCDEALHVLEGELVHSLGDEEYVLKAGDTIHIPQNMVHQARNPGTIPCRIVVAYNTGRRQVVGEFGDPAPADPYRER